MGTSLVDKAHEVCKRYSSEPEELNRQIGSLMVSHGKEPVIAALIECLSISYTRLRFSSK